MVWSVTDRGSINGTGSSYSIPSFTPGADRLLVLAVYNQNSGAARTVSNHDGGGSWVEINTLTGPWSGRLSLWACITGSSPSANDIDITGQSGLYWATCLEIDGGDVSGTVANAFGVSDTDNGLYNATITFSLASFASATNMTLGVITHYYTGTNEVFQTDGNFTIASTSLQGIASPNGFFAYDDAEDTAFNMNSTNITGVETIGIAYEIKEAASNAITDVNLVDLTGATQTSLTNLRWSWFDGVSPSSFSAPSDQGTTESTDGSGNITLDLPNSTLASGQDGVLVLSDASGTIMGAYRLTTD